MIILGIESSCDECAAAVVEEGKTILSNHIATQIAEHAPFNGVVPEMASRLHTQWISGVVRRALEDSGKSLDDLDGVAVAARPGLMGSLLVGVSFAKALAWGRDLPLIGVDHVKAHLYAPRFMGEIKYPFLGLLVSGGHTMIAQVNSFDDFTVLGTTIDDACGEAFDKVAKFYDLGYPGGVAIEKLARGGDPRAFHFPKPRLKQGRRKYDVSYSGLKTAVVNQRLQFKKEGAVDSLENLAASFQRTAVDILIGQLIAASADTGITRIVAGGGVAANSYLREQLTERKEWETWYPPLNLCTDNGAMIAGIGYHYLQRGDRSPLSLNASARVDAFKGFIQKSPAAPRKGCS